MDGNKNNCLELKSSDCRHFLLSTFLAACAKKSCDGKRIAEKLMCFSAHV